MKLNGKYGVVDSKGNLVMGPNLFYAESLSNSGLIGVCEEEGGYSGIVGASGYILKPQFCCYGDFGKNGLCDVMMEVD